MGHWNIKDIPRVNDSELKSVPFSEIDCAHDGTVCDVISVTDTIGRVVPQEVINKLDKEEVADNIAMNHVMVSIDGYIIELYKIPNVVQASVKHPIPKELIDIALDYGLSVQRLYRGSYLHTRKIRMRGKDIKGRTTASIPNKIYLEVSDPYLERSTLFHEIGHAIVTRTKDDTTKPFITYADEMAAWEIGFAIARRYGYHYKPGCREMEEYKYCITSYLPDHLMSLGLSKKDMLVIFNKLRNKKKSLDKFPGTEKTVPMTTELSKHIRKWCLMTPEKIERERKFLYSENGIELEEK